MIAAWKETLIAARDAGHDLQLHGLTHADLPGTKVPDALRR